MYYKAKHAFGVMYRGEFITVAEGEIVPDTRGTEGAKLLHKLGKAGLEEHFEPVETFGRFDHKAAADVEQATAAPGEKRRVAHPRKSTRKRTTTRAGK